MFYNGGCLVTCYGNFAIKTYNAFKLIHLYVIKSEINKFIWVISTSDLDYRHKRLFPEVLSTRFLHCSSNFCFSSRYCNCNLHVTRPWYQWFRCGSYRWAFFLPFLLVTTSIDNYNSIYIWRNFLTSKCHLYWYAFLNI